MVKVELLAITPKADKVIEEAGRTCYLSFDKITPKSSEKFIQMLLKSKHSSVLEHAYATFKIKGGSRSFTHQIVRHRLCSFSQQSQRYVSEKEFSFITPPAIKENKIARDIYNNFINQAKDIYQKLIDLGIKKEDARFVLPNALESEIVISANFRQFRHVFELRCAKNAQWEIRSICLEMLTILKKQAPAVFADFNIDRENKVAIIN
jgi:thymidylate synthase (FAD)